jgi:hypothetical protein
VIYYKHKITQEKIEDHPTDIEFRKKYEQLKEKAVRKNLKSISMKHNLGMQGMLNNKNSGTSGIGIMNSSGMPSSGMVNASGISGVSKIE